MQHHRTEAAPARQSNQSHSGDFDFGQARATGKPRKTARPGLTAGLIGFAFAISMFMPVGAKAEAAWQRYPDQLSEPVRPGILPEVLNVDSRRGGAPAGTSRIACACPGFARWRSTGAAATAVIPKIAFEIRGCAKSCRVTAAPLPASSGSATGCFRQAACVISAICCAIDPPQPARPHSGRAVSAG